MYLSAELEPAGLPEPSSHHSLLLPQLLASLLFVKYARPGFSLGHCPGLSSPWDNVLSPFIFMALSHFSLLTNHLLISLFKMTPPPVAFLPCSTFLHSISHLVYCVILYNLLVFLSSKSPHLECKF